MNSKISNIKLIKPIKVLGSRGHLEYFAQRRVNLVIGSFIDVFIRPVKEKQYTDAIVNKDWDRIPSHSWLIADAPHNLVNAEGLIS